MTDLTVISATLKRTSLSEYRYVQVRLKCGCDRFYWLHPDWRLRKELAHIYRLSTSKGPSLKSIVAGLVGTQYEGLTL
jgi:hypothetical protein